MKIDENSKQYKKEGFRSVIHFLNSLKESF